MDPVDRHVAVVPEADLRSRHGWLWAMVALATAVTAVVGINGFYMRSHEQVLDERGVQTEALVLDRAYGRTYRPGFPDVAVVRYTVDGTMQRTSLTVESADEFVIGETIIIEYDPHAPGHARPLRGWDPTYRTRLLFGAVLVPITAVSALLTRRRLKADTMAARAKVVAEGHGAPYRRTRWLPYGPYSTDLVACGSTGPVEPGLRPIRSRSTPASLTSVRGRCAWSGPHGPAVTWSCASTAAPSGPRAE